MITEDEDAVPPSAGISAQDELPATRDQLPGGGESGAAVRRLEGRLARLEAQVHANTDRLAQFDQGTRIKKQRGLWIRLALLGLALAALFYLRMRSGS